MENWRCELWRWKIVAELTYMLSGMTVRTPITKKNRPQAIVYTLTELTWFYSILTTAHVSILAFLSTTSCIATIIITFLWIKVPLVLFQPTRLKKSNYCKKIMIHLIVLGKVFVKFPILSVFIFS